MFGLREWEINPWKKIQDPAGIRTQDLLNTSQMLLPLSHLDPWQRSGRQAIHRQHCLEASAEFQLILTLSELDWTETLAELSNLEGPCSRDRSPPRLRASEFHNLTWLWLLGLLGGLWSRLGLEGKVMLKSGQEDLIVAEEACVEEGQSGACLVQGSNKQCLLAVSSLELVETVHHSTP